MSFLSHFYGVIVNTLTVIIGSLIGLGCKKGIPKRITDAVMKAIGLCTLAIGITGILKGQNQLVMILSMVPGVILGTLADIDGKITALGNKLSARFSNQSGSSFAQGFITSSLLFCVGAMTIVGSINAGISSDNQMLYTKSVLDFISSVMLAASLGAGVLFSGGFVFLFQGLLVVLALLLGSFLSEAAIAEIICTGSVMIFALGLNLLGIAKIKVANLLPALVLVPFVLMLFNLLPL